MLDSMCHAWHVSLVTVVSNVDIHARAGLVCLRIVDEECFELVGESNDAVGSIIQGRCLEVVRHQLRW